MGKVRFILIETFKMIMRRGDLEVNTRVDEVGIVARELVRVREANEE